MRSSFDDQSLWTAIAPGQYYPPLLRDARADVCVIGAGVAGLSVALRLAQVGRKVIVIDEGKVGAAMTARSSAHLVTAVDDRYFDLAERHGPAATRLIATAHGWAIDRIDDTVAELNLSCGFERVDGILTLAAGHDEKLLERELTAARNAGLHDVELVCHQPFASFPEQQCLKFPRQAQLDPLAYVLGLARGVSRLGGQIYEWTRVDDVTGGVPVQVSVGRHTVTADAAVIATNVPIPARHSMAIKQEPYMTYVITSRVARGEVERALVWDSGDPYHYVRLHGAPHAKYNHLIVGGEDHRGDAPQNARSRFARLEAWMRERYLTSGPVEYAWTGRIMEAADRLPFIGHSPSGERGVYIVTGESGTGMTHATIAGEIINTLLDGGSNAWTALYDPARTPRTTARDVPEEAA